jgi:predicted signal transduction protein with EAL and GGDEF domain
VADLWHWSARFVHFAFWYCTDFMVNLANRTHTSYNEVNTWVLLLLIPGLLALLVGVRVVQWVQLRRLTKGPSPIAYSPRPDANSVI